MSEDAVAYVCAMQERFRRREMTPGQMLAGGWRYVERAEAGYVRVIYNLVPDNDDDPWYQGVGEGPDSATAHRRAIQNAWERVGEQEG